MRLPIALGSYKRSSGGLPEMFLRNLLLEQTPATDEKIILLPRPGLTVTRALGGTNPVQAVWTEPGVFGGDVIALCGGGVYRNGTSIGSAASSAGARFAASNTEMVFSSAGTLYRTNGVTVTNPAFPDGASVAAAGIFDNFFLAVRKDSGRLYWSAVGDGTNWPALNFATAEARPDNLIDLIVLNDNIALIGQESIEFWQPNPNSDPNLPFTRIDGLTYSKGALNTGAATYCDNTLVWVGNDGIVYRRGAVPLRISDHGVEEQISAAGTAQLFSFPWVGHTILALVLPAMTLFFDFETKQWSEASTYGRANWRAQCGCPNGTAPVLGDAYGGNILGLDATALTDAGDVVERKFTALVPERTILDNVFLDAQGGIATTVSGNPITIELSISADGGQTYSSFLSSIGQTGQYRRRAAWRRLGSYDLGAIINFRVTDPAPFAVQSLHANEPLTGRSA